MIKKFFTENPKATITPWLSKNSSFIQGIQYDKGPGILYVRISGKDYHYDVGLDLADEFSRASSWGRFYDERIKIHEIAQPKGITQRAPRVPESSHDSAIKDVLGATWGVAEIGLIFLPFQFKWPAQLALLAANIGINAYMAKQDIDIPPQMQAIIDLGLGYSIYSGLSSITKRSSLYFSTVATPYFNIGYRTGTVTAKVTPAQATAGILFGAGKWKKTLVDIDRRKAVLDYLDAFKIPGTQLYDITDDEIQMIKNFTDFNISRRKTLGAEKALDFVIKNQKYVPATVAGTFLAARGVHDAHDYMEQKKPKKGLKRSKRPTLDISDTGISVTTTILDITK